MSYYFKTTLDNVSFDEAIGLVTEELKQEGFGILTEIDVKQTFKNKLDVDFRQYRILGACNPTFAYRALQEEGKIGVFLPCNVVVEENDNGSIDISAVDPIASMMAVQNDNLGDVAMEVQRRLQGVIQKLQSTHGAQK